MRETEEFNPRIITKIDYDTLKHKKTNAGQLLCNSHSFH